MRIVNRAEMKAMPVGTLYTELGDTQRHGWPAAPDSIFLGAIEGMNDFNMVSIGSPDAESSHVLFDRHREMEETGAAYPVGLATDREGLYDDDLRYLVWEPEDVRDIIARTAWFAAQQGEWNPVRRYRIRRPDGSTRYDLEDRERDARECARPGDVVEQMHERHETEWRALP